MTHMMSNRLLKINVGFLLADGPGHDHDSLFDFPALRVSEDVTLNYLRGPIRLSRTAEGILVQADLEAGVEAECYRCLDTVNRPIQVEIEELFAHPPSQTTDFSVGEDAILDLAPLLREEVLIEDSHGVLCRPDCKGLCPTCGSNRNHTSCKCHEDDIDPRLAALKNLLK